MFIDRSILKKDDIFPGVVLYISDPFVAFAVVLDRDAWAKLAINEFSTEQIEEILKDDQMIVLRVLGLVQTMAVGDVQRAQLLGIEPNDEIFRHYTVISTESQHYQVIQSRSILQEFIWLLGPIVHPNKYLSGFAFELKLLRDYVDGKVFAQDELSSYGYKLLDIFKKSIPLVT